MDASTVSTVLHVGVIAAIAVGVAFIALGTPLQTGVGVVLVILGLIGLMPALRFRLATDRPAGEGGRVRSATGPGENSEAGGGI